MHSILMLEGSPIVVNAQVIKIVGSHSIFRILSGSKMDLPSKRDGAALAASLVQVYKLCTTEP